MFLSIRHKLTLAFAVLFLLIFTVLGFYLANHFANQYQGQFGTTADQRYSLVGQIGPTGN